MNIVKITGQFSSALACIIAASSCANTPLPADKFDLSQWKITLPVDKNNDGRVDEIDVRSLKKFSHPDFFYLDEQGHLVFRTPNKAATTSGSTNTRSELRQMLRGTRSSVKTSSPKNNFALKAHPKAKEFSSIGGNMKGTLRVNHVPVNAKYPEKFPAFSVVVGQIHAGKNHGSKLHNLGYGWGNEPLKIYYKKWPNHNTGSVFWTYERNLAKKDPRRRDLAFPVWGNTWDISSDPAEQGLTLGEEFSYEVNVYGNIMQLVFESPGRETVEYRVDLSNNVDPYGRVDTADLPGGYTGDWMYFKAGAYDQCSVKDDPGFWYPACGGTGVWETDFANGDFASVTFSNLELGKAINPDEVMKARLAKKALMKKDAAVKKTTQIASDDTYDVAE